MLEKDCPTRDDGMPFSFEPSFGLIGVASPKWNNRKKNYYPLSKLPSGLKMFTRLLFKIGNENTRASLNCNRGVPRLDIVKINGPPVICCFLSLFHLREWQHVGSASAICSGIFDCAQDKNLAFLLLPGRPSLWFCFVVVLFDRI